MILLKTPNLAALIGFVAALIGLIQQFKGYMNHSVDIKQLKVDHDPQAGFEHTKKFDKCVMISLAKKVVKQVKVRIHYPGIKMTEVECSTRCVDESEELWSMN